MRRSPLLWKKKASRRRKRLKGGLYIVDISVQPCFTTVEYIRGGRTCFLCSVHCESCALQASFAKGAKLACNERVSGDRNQSCDVLRCPTNVPISGFPPSSIEDVSLVCLVCQLCTSQWDIIPLYAPPPQSRYVYYYDINVTDHPGTLCSRQSR